MVFKYQHMFLCFLILNDFILIYVMGNKTSLYITPTDATLYKYIYMKICGGILVYAIDLTYYDMTFAT